MFAPDAQYAVFNGSEYVVLIFLNEYAVLDKKVRYAVSNRSGYAVARHVAWEAVPYMVVVAPQCYHSDVDRFWGCDTETFDWDEEEVSDKEEVTQVKVPMALADDELTVRKSHARNGVALHARVVLCVRIALRVGVALRVRVVLCVRVALRV
ncbi:hypothetical protein Tco_1068478 [Tanacetum coccineum]|uniref:Uncharacterized protein n=1 Tax=Tanacetum coccineum TaxID=301880 RepID=A0ABQ5HFV0_9ASTR